MKNYLKGQIIKNYNRTQEIQVSKGTKEKLEAGAVMHALKGNIDDYCAIMDSLGKLQTQNAIVDDITAMKVMQAQILKQLGVSEEVE